MALQVQAYEAALVGNQPQQAPSVSLAVGIVVGLLAAFVQSLGKYFFVKVTTLTLIPHDKHRSYRTAQESPRQCQPAA